MAEFPLPHRTRPGTMRRAIRCEKGSQQQWFKPYAQLRKRDPLLVFLAHARNAETHAVCPTIDKPIRVMVRDKAGVPFSIKSITSTLDDGVLTIDIDTASHDSLLDYEAHVLPTAPMLVRFRDRGVWYEVPNSHRGNHYCICTLSTRPASHSTSTRAL